MSNEYSGPKYPADRPRGYAKIEQATLRARQRLGFSPTNSVPGESILWRFKDITIPIGGTEYPLTWDVQDRLPENELARASFETNEQSFVVTFSKETYEFLEAEDWSSQHCRARFSLCHELGHVFLHSNEVKRLGEIPVLGSALLRAGYRGLKPFQDAEWQANVFAAAFQCPALGLKALEDRKRLTLQEVQDTFQLSRTAAARRLKTYHDRREELLKASWIAKALGRQPQG